MHCNQSCLYIKQDKRIKTDREKVWEQSKLFHLAPMDDTTWGFTDIWDKLTRWLPNFRIKQLSLTCIAMLFLEIFIFRILYCFLFLCHQTGRTYEEWKKHRLRQRTEEGKDFLDRNGIICQEAARLKRRN